MDAVRMRGSIMGGAFWGAGTGCAPITGGRGHTKFVARDATRHYKVIKSEQKDTPKSRWNGLISQGEWLKLGIMVRTNNYRHL